MHELQILQEPKSQQTVSCWTNRQTTNFTAHVSMGHSAALQSGCAASGAQQGS